MADLRVKRMEAGQAKIRNVPIAVTPEGFWCCPSPAAFQKTMKNQSFHGNSRPTPTPPSPAPTKLSLQRTQLPPAERSPIPEAPGSSPAAASAAGAPARTPKRSSDNSSQRKVTVGFGRPETSDLKVLLSGKDGIAVRMNVHRDVLAEHSIFFADRLAAAAQSPPPCLDLLDCEDVEIYVETVGLMYSKDVKQRLIKQSVPRVLRIMKVAEALGFQACVRACLEHLEAVPWVEEEEESVVSSVRHLHAKNLGASRILRRVSSEAAAAPNETIERIIELVLRSGEDKGRREMKSLVLKLLKENSLLIGGGGSGGAADICVGTLYDSSRSCLESLLSLFRRASEEAAAAVAAEKLRREICLEADNLLWLVEIMAERRAAEEFAGVWAGQEELAALHRRLPVASRHLVSCVTARLFVGIGRGEVLPAKETRRRLLRLWLQPLIEDFNWLQHRRRSFDGKVVEEGIGKTILTLPLEDQQSVLLSWLGSFLKAGDGCPNLQRAFEVWWRRTFIRPFMEQHRRHQHQQQGDASGG